MERIFKALRVPGARYAVEYAAPTQVVANAIQYKNDEAVNISAENDTTYAVKTKSRLLDRWLDTVVKFSGSEFVFFSIMAALLTWAFLGIPFGQSNDWQVGISDAQAIINMVFDAFLMRQQLNSYDSLLVVSACLRSRNMSNKRMLRALIESGEYEPVKPTQFHELQQMEFASELPAENLLGRVSTKASAFVGHIATVIVFWVGIFIWIGFGAYCNWSNTWQLYINSATSALMVFILAFLANIRERHSNYTTKCLESIYLVDTALEVRLRTITGDCIENRPVVIHAPKRGRIQRGIDYYADLVGTLIGIAILFLVIIIWVVIGPAMSFSSNWWLLIGTYAGLIGMNDGFVLRNVQNQLGGYENAEFVQLTYDDMDMLAVIGVTQLEEERVADNSFSCRISVAMGSFCSHEATVILGAVTIVGLVIGASAMGWSVTGQLLCNVPPSIIESFFMMILITGHNIGDAKRRVDLHNIYLRRLKLISYVNTLVESVKE
jgi:low-affinity ferrous iron transport protein